MTTLVSSHGDQLGGIYIPLRLLDYMKHGRRQTYEVPSTDDPEDNSEYREVFDVGDPLGITWILNSVPLFRSFNPEHIRDLNAFLDSYK